MPEYDFHFEVISTSSRPEKSPRVPTQGYKKRIEKLESALAQAEAQVELLIEQITCVTGVACPPSREKSDSPCSGMDSCGQCWLLWSMGAAGKRMLQV
jgi:hypothetical protein